MSFLSQGILITRGYPFILGNRVLILHCLVLTCIRETSFLSLLCLLVTDIGDIGNEASTPRDWSVAYPHHGFLDEYRYRRGAIPSGDDRFKS